jgi:hypothetical protein
LIETIEPDAVLADKAYDAAPLLKGIGDTGQGSDSFNSGAQGAA